MGPKKKKAKDALFMTDEDLEEQEEAKKKAEQERLEKERLQKEMEEELRKAKIEKKNRENNEMKCEELRNRLLKEHCSEFEKFSETHLDYLKEKRREKEWQVYVSCNHLPFANDPPALNTFLYTWSLIEDQLNIENVLPESEIILETIQPVDGYINDPLDMKETTINNLREVKLNYYNQILKNIDKVTFDAIMDVGKYHKQIQPSQIEIYIESENLLLWMWAWSIEGRSESTPKKKRPERKLPMMLVTLPGILEVKRYHLRIFHTSYDPYSFQSESYHPPQVTNVPNLYEETVNIRKMEVNALKLRYMNNYDEDIMPWWFFTDKEIMEERARREQFKKTKLKKKKLLYTGQVENVANVKPNEPETTKVSYHDTEEGDNMPVKQKKKTRKEKTFDDDVIDEENEKESIPYRMSGPGITKILYSRSMSDLMEKRKNECRGPQYFPEVDPIEYLEQTILSSSESSRERYKDLFISEKHTTFKACLYTGDDCLSDGVILRDINDCLNRSDPSEERLSFTDRRVFLDWKSFREMSPDREAIRGELEDILFGDTEIIIDKGEVKRVKRNTNLRSIKDLLANLIISKSSHSNIRDQNTRPDREKEQEHPINVQHMDLSPKVTNITEMKAVEMEIANIIDTAWQENIDNYVKKLKISLEPGSINLRQVMIIGGVFQFDFFADEPQPFVNNDLFKMQLHYGEHELKRVPFDQIPKVRIDLAAEAERQMNLAKRQKSLRKMSRITLSTNEPAADDAESVALGDDDLVWFSLELPKKKIYFQSPMPVRWNADKMHWTSDDVYDTKWNERSYTCNFKLGKSGPFAISVFRFSNLPYISFCLKPSSDWKKNPEIELEIMTRNFPIKFKIKEDTVTIAEFGDIRADFVSHIINVPFTFEELVEAMRFCGIDLFPDWDSFLYINSSLKKLKTLEVHMYYCMGCSAPAFDYSSSLHNSGSRDDRIYVQLKECVEKNIVPSPKYRTVLAEPFKVAFVGSEKIGLLAEEDADRVGYMPDLKYLTEIIASKKALRRMRKASKRTIGTVISLITATKILSYS